MGGSKKHRKKHKSQRHSEERYKPRDPDGKVQQHRESHRTSSDYDLKPKSSSEKPSSDHRHNDRLTSDRSTKHGYGKRKRQDSVGDLKDSHSEDRSFRNEHRHHPHSVRQETSPERVNNASEDEETSCSDVDWKAHRRQLDRTFFTSEDIIHRGKQDYDDFWSFLQRYITFQKKNKTKKSSASKVIKNCKESPRFGLPAQYDKHHRINVSLVTKHQPKWESRRSDHQEELSSTQLKQFKNILLCYLDFSQKQKFAKLQKIRRAQHDLPIYQHKTEIVEAVQQHQVVVVAGDTGCGKSTQVPQYLLEAGFAHIACTQPRRIACVSLSKRVSYETLNEYGSEVAYQVRFDKSRTRASRIIFLTEGLLLRQVGTDSLLSQYSVIVIDEVHERHLQTDFILGVMKYLLHQREDLKLVLMSATINITMFSSYFDDAPIVKVPGRLYPIQLHYCPISGEEKSGKLSRLDPSPFLRILQLIDNKFPATERGDVLMFLSGMTEIMTIVEACQEYAKRNNRWIILPLHSALSVAEQDKVFDYPPEGVRKCIVSTNIAETSVTIDGVRFVVDSGKVKEMSFDTKYKMQRLQEFWISQASAEQRKGRAGRTGPGLCYRLYAESDYTELQEYSTPEVQRVPLDSLILQMMDMGLKDPRKFPFVEEPAAGAIETSIAYLKEQGAVNKEEELTSLGEMLAQLPVDITIGKMLIMASLFHMVDPVLTTAAALSVQTPFTAKGQRDIDAMSARKKLESEHGDPLTLLNAYDEWIQVKTEGHDTRKWCKRRGLEQQRFYEMSKLKAQFSDLLKEHKLLEGRSTQQMKSMEGLNSTERRQLHADRKQLGKLRREHKNIRHKPKILKLEGEDWQVEQQDVETDEPDLEGDIKDLEFRLTNNLDKLQEQTNQTRQFRLKDINLLKVILCSGLYPQLAIADPHNSHKADSEQMYHTKDKGFVLLHPTSVFAIDPEPLQLKDIDVKETQVTDTLRGQWSSKHQLVAYVSLLETTKPYLTGLMRVPALQTLFLFSNQLDTNTDCTRVVCDGWLEVTFEEAEEAEVIISNVVQLRSTWLHLIRLHLPEEGLSPGEEEEVHHKAHHLQKLLGKKLAEFLDSKMNYTLRQVLSAEQQHMYIGPQQANSAVLGDLLLAGGDEHPVKGGVIVTEYLTHNCLDDSESSSWGGYSSCLQKHWSCERCGISLVVTLAQRLQHQQQCHLEAAKSTGEDVQVKKKASKGAKTYHCPVCDKDLALTPIEILKHKKCCKR